MNYEAIIKNKHWTDLIDDMSLSEEDRNKFKEWTFKKFWEESDHGDCMLYIAAGEIDRKLLVQTCCQIARLTIHLVPESEKRPLIAIETAERWCSGEASIEEVESAANAADAYAHATHTATHAAYAAAAASVVANAAEAVYAAAAAVYAVAAHKTIKKEIANLVRQEIANMIRQSIPMPTKQVDEYERVLKLKAFL